jgi:hypothetical protein
MNEQAMEWKNPGDDRDGRRRDRLQRRPRHRSVGARLLESVAERVAVCDSTVTDTLLALPL